jgi:hypothetical protein
VSTTIPYRPARARAWAASIAGGWPRSRAALFGFLLVAPVAADQGGYWPTAWGWAALALLFVAMLALVLGTERLPTRIELAFGGLLAALFVWVLLSSLWAASSTQPVRESQRALVYAAAVAAALLLLRRDSVHFLLGGVWAAIVVVAGYGLLTRLQPDRLNVADDIAGNRLSEPLGYWNALGLFAAMGALLALGLAGRAGSRVVRAVAAASLLVLVPTLYFTYSRGAWIALGVGLVAALAVDRRRLQLVTALIAAVPWAAAGVLIASRSDALTHTTTTVEVAAPEGHRLMWILALLALGAALSTVAAALLEPRVAELVGARIAYGAALWLVALGGAIAIFSVYGTPWAIAERGYHGFLAPPSGSSSNLNERLFSFSGNRRNELWQVAWRDSRAHPWLGSGAGTYERYWNQLRPFESKVRDAHNLYVESLAEIGPFGLALLVGVLGAPLVGLRRARREPLVPAMVGAYAAFLVHAAVDWDWEIPAVTLTALLCGAGLVVSARRGSRAPLGTRPRIAAVGVLLALAAFTFVGLKGNRAIAASESASGAGNWTKMAAEARTATDWAPWSARGWQLLGEAQSRQGRQAPARVSLRKALAKDPSDWTIWLDLAVASRGAEQRRAFAEARKLNPLSSEITSWEPAGTTGGGG